MKTRTKLFHLSLFTFHFSLFLLTSLPLPLFALTADRSAEVTNRPMYFAYRSFVKQHEMTRTFADMGVNVRCLTLANTKNLFGTGYCPYPPYWTGFGEYDFAQVDANIGEIVKASPGAKLIVNIDLNSPIWLERRLCVDSFNNLSQAAADSRWREAMERNLRDTIAYVEKKWGDRVLAYLLMSGRTTEWVDWNPAEMTYNKNHAWRQWCQKHGRKWGRATPDCEALNEAAFDGTVYDPATEGDKIDFWRFSEGLVADTLLGFAHVARVAAGTQKEIGVFFGYSMNCDNRVHIGQSDWPRVADSPDVDFFIAPPTYRRENRGCGAGTGPLTMYSSLRLRGKRWLHEIDFNAHDTKTFCFGRVFDSLEEDIAGNTREGAFAIVNHGSLWWFDMWGGFYDAPALRERIAKLHAIARRFEKDASPVYGDVLLVADPESAYGNVTAGPHSTQVAQLVRNALTRIGCASDYLTFDELALVDLAKYKVLVFHASTTITPARRKFLEEKVLKDGRTVVWVFAPGVSDGRTLDAARVKDLTGVEFKTPGVTTVARDGWTSVYGYAHELFTPEVLRQICEKAGAHCWTDELLPVAANERLVMVHAKTGGKKTIHLPKRVAKVVDLLNDRVVGENCTEVEIEFATPDTRLFEMVR